MQEIVLAKVESTKEGQGGLGKFLEISNARDKDEAHSRQAMVVDTNREEHDVSGEQGVQDMSRNSPIKGLTPICKACTDKATMETMEKQTSVSTIDIYKE
jgi:hypothetical protein